MGKKILVIDDDSDILNTIRDLLESGKMGYEVTAELDGRKAIELAKENKYDLILIDVMMPFPGREVAKILKDEAIGNPKLVFCTVVPKPEVELKDMHGFIQKPLDPKKFLSDIKKLL